MHFMNNIYKFTFKYLNIIYIIILIFGLCICAYLSGNNNWLQDSASYLGTQKGSTGAFAVFVFLISATNYFFLIISAEFVYTKFLKQGYQKVLIGGSVLHFSISYAALITAGIVPYTINNLLHLTCAFIFFIFYLLGIIFLSASLWESDKEFARVTAIILIVYIAGGSIFLNTTLNYTPTEFFAFSLLVLWNLGLNRKILISKQFARLH